MCAAWRGRIAAIGVWQVAVAPILIVAPSGLDTGLVAAGDMQSANGLSCGRTTVIVGLGLTEPEVALGSRRAGHDDHIVGDRDGRGT
jgi:hypothetical protein